MLSTIVNATTGEYIGRGEVGHFNSSILVHTKLPHTEWPKKLAQLLCMPQLYRILPIFKIISLPELGQNL